MHFHQEADLGLVPVAITLERYEAIEFCGRIGGDYSGILVRYPEASVSFTGAIEVFSIKVSSTVAHTSINFKMKRTIIVYWLISNAMSRYGSVG